MNDRQDISASVVLVLLCLCTSCIDPTEQVLQVVVHNDTKVNVVIEQCGYGCGSAPTEVDRLGSEQSITVNTSDDDVPNYWLIVDGQGHKVGCLNLIYNGRPQNPRALISDASRATSCPT